MHGKNVIGFEKSGLNTDYVRSFSPLLNTYLEGQFCIATSDEIQRTIQKAEKAFSEFKSISGDKRAEFLLEIAHGLIDDDLLIERAMYETALSTDRLISERARTIHQLKSFARMLQEGSYIDAIIETAQDHRQPLRKPDLRKMLLPLGPVLVFTASNFPLAYSTAGGDTASALAAGNPVIVKAHESHLGTNERVADIICQAARRSGMPDGVFSSLIGKGNHLGKELAMHPGIKAIGFTGSQAGGKAIYNFGTTRKNPIPVFAEMGSVNPVLLFPDALNKNRSKIVRDYVKSITQDMGQFCTNPGLIIGIKNRTMECFIEELGEKIRKKMSETMLSETIWTNFYTSRQKKLDQKGVRLIAESSGDEELKGKPTLATVSAQQFLQNTHLWKEVFGPFSLIVLADTADEMKEVVNHLEGQLTLTIIGNASDYKIHQDLISTAEQKAGRIIFNGVPTGVEVCRAMHHGGPFPATTDSRFTAVGEDAIYRWLRPLTYQDCPDAMLPEALKNSNPLNIVRRVNGHLSTSPI